MSKRSLAIALLIEFFITTVSIAQKKISCPDGDHYQIDVSQIAIQYEGQSFKSTLSSLSILAAGISIEPKKLQTASAATQQWNEYVKTLAVGYNSCAITKIQFNDALQQIYPRLKQDAGDLEQIRRIIAEGHKADEARLNKTLNSYFENLRRFVLISGNQIELERITAVVENIKGTTEDIQKRLDELNARVEKLEKPALVQTEIRKSLTAKADEAEAAYNDGYELFEKFRFSEAADCFRRALTAVKLPDFYFALGLALREVPDLDEAERAFRDGLAQSFAGTNDERRAELNAALGTVLFAKGDLAGAIDHTQLALTLDTETVGPLNENVVRDSGNLGQFLQTKGDIQAALTYSLEALKTAEKIFGPDDWRLAVAANNMAIVLGDRLDKGDLEEALRYHKLALGIAERASDSPKVALYSSNIASLLQAKLVKEKGDPAEALRYARRALEIASSNYGPDHPYVAGYAYSLGVVFANAGDPDSALRYIQQALTIDRRVYGPDHPNVGRDLFGAANCLFYKGRLDEALASAQRASEIHEISYGPASTALSKDLNLVGMILAQDGKVNVALGYKQRAFEMDQKMYGSDNIEVAHDAYDLGEFLYAQGKLKESLAFFERALKIEEKVYGPEDPFTKRIAANVERIRQQTHNKTEESPK